MGSKLSQINEVTLTMTDLEGNKIMTLPAKEASIKYNSYDLYSPQEVEMNVSLNDEVLKELIGVLISTSDNLTISESPEPKACINSFETICNKVSDNLTNRIEELVKSFIDVNSPELNGYMYIDTVDHYKDIDKKLEF